MSIAIKVNENLFFLRFTIQNNEGCGWVLKAPFTTNSEHVRFPKSFDALMECLMTCSRDQSRFPYIIIQPCLYNRKEMKVVCFGGKPLYVSKSSAKRSSDGTNRSISIKPHGKLFEFVENAMQCYLTHCPYAILDGLFRVDVMQTKDKEYVVNEFESLEAAYFIL